MSMPYFAFSHEGGLAAEAVNMLVAPPVMRGLTTLSPSSVKSRQHRSP
jgi:hypothetical protein